MHRGRSIRDGDRVRVCRDTRRRRSGALLRRLLDADRQIDRQTVWSPFTYSDAHVELDETHATSLAETASQDPVESDGRVRATYGVTVTVSVESDLKSDTRAVARARLPQALWTAIGRTCVQLTDGDMPGAENERMNERRRPDSL